MDPIEHLLERRAILAHSLSVYRRHCEDFARAEALPHMHSAHPWWSVRGRILTQPPEYHALRHDSFMRERKRQQERYDQRDRGNTILGCGCVVATDPNAPQRQVTVHMCPNHWNARKR